MVQERAITAAVVLIGNELLSGRTQDTNLSYIAKGLVTKGIRVVESRVIPDDHDHIVTVINELRKKYTYVFTTGGIGPTHDDITADCVADAFSVNLPIHPEAKQLLLNYFDKRGIEVNDDRLRMARIPDGASLIDNPVSIAPGFRLHNVFVFAGVPKIMQAMFENVLPTLETGEVINSVSIRCNLGEGTIASPLRAIQADYPNVDIGSYPGNTERGYFVTVVARSTNESLLKAVAERVTQAILDKGGTLTDLPE